MYVPSVGLIQVLKIVVSLKIPNELNYCTLNTHTHTPYTHSLFLNLFVEQIGNMKYV